MLRIICLYIYISQIFIYYVVITYIYIYYVIIRADLMEFGVPFRLI